MEEIKYIIEKIELVSGSVVSSIIGYITSIAESEQINVKYNEYAEWVRINRSDLVAGNKNISEYLTVNGSVYSASASTTNVEGMNLALINDITPYI